MIIDPPGSFPASLHRIDAHALGIEAVHGGGSGPDHPSIADFFHTSVWGLGYGWSFQADAAYAFIGYAAYRGYDFASHFDYFYNPEFLWNAFTREIDTRPMMFLVDTSGSGSTDNFVPVIGYDDRGADGFWYGHDIARSRAPDAR